MFHYAFTNDLRISTLDESLKKAAQCFIDETVPKSTEDKSANNNMMTLGFYFNLSESSNCAHKAAKGDVRSVVINFIKKFQFPNPRTKEAYDLAINDGIKLVPMRIIIKLLYTMKILHGDAVAYLTKEEIKYFIFANEKVAKVKNPDIGEVISDIVSFRKTGMYPDYVDTDDGNCIWKHEDRQLREMLKLLVWSGCIREVDNKFIVDNDSLSSENKAAIFDVINCDSFWEGDSIESYREYMDMEVLEDELIYMEDHKSEKEKYTPEWFNEKGIPLAYMDEELMECAAKFANKYGPSVLQELDGETLLETIFLNGKNKDNLCYELEYDNQLIQLAGSIKGGSAYKYGLFYNRKENTWITGSSRKPQRLSLEEAIEVGLEIRDSLLAGQAVIEGFGSLNSQDDYEKLYVELNVATNGNIAKSWFMKYYFLLNPSTISPNYTLWAQNTFVKALGMEPGDNPITRMGQLQLFNKRCEVSPIVFSTVFWKNFDATEGEQEMNDVEKAIPVKFNTGYQSTYQRNRILFGAPGTGKSFTVNKDKNDLLNDGGEYERVTFHPDYTYANFVGTYKPVPAIDSMGNDVITYEYVPGPFMRTLVNALDNGRTETVKPYLLIVEEINRANVAAVFGDVFQLLDRVDNVSEYPIQASEDIRKYMAKELGGEPDDYTTIQIPDNMFIWATMNSADQGVFPMDTAFKRRWDFTYLSINTNEEKIAGQSVTLGTGSDLRVVEWNKLRKAINEELVTYKINEDKLLGTFFIPKDRVPGGDRFTEEEFKRIFKNKVIMYLFDDAARQKSPTLFAGCKKKLYSEICDSFDTMGVNIFCDNIRNKFAAEEE